jgi:hypothetical protein
MASREEAMDWRWTARRLLISTFLIGHMIAVWIWVLPYCPVRDRSYSRLEYYMMPLGLWQYWAMFAPDPVRDTVTLEAEVIDAKGLRYTFPFPRLADYSELGAIPRYRHTKFVANLAGEHFLTGRKIAARHAVRQLHLAAAAFPLDVQLIYQIRRTSPPGQPPTDPMTPTVASSLHRFQFARLEEVQP